MAWRDTVRGWFGGKQPETAEKRAQVRAEWLPADATPFGVRVLDLGKVTGGLISTSESPAEAEMAVSWGRRVVTELELELVAKETVACELRYPADDDLPEGWLFTATKMEEKWVIGYRDGRIFGVRSWTGDVKFVADTRREAGELIVERLHLNDGSLRVFGDPVQTFDWLLRSHALGQVVPLPVDENAADLLESIPLAVFSHYGCVARYAAMTWDPARPARPLRATSAVVTAVRLDKPSKIAALAAAGQSLTTTHRSRAGARRRSEGSARRRCRSKC